MSFPTLTFAECVRLRPGLYLGSSDGRGLRHLLHEFTLEAVANCPTAPRIELGLLPGGGFTARDNGPGLPVAPWETGAFPSALWYWTAAAVSSRFIVEKHRGGQVWREEHVQGVAAVQPFVVGETSTTGTVISFRPDPEVFEECPEFSFSEVRDELHTLACLHPDGQFLLRDSRPRPATEEVFTATAGLADLLCEMTHMPPVHPTVIRGALRTAAGEVSVAFRWCLDTEERLLTFANDRRMEFHGTPVTGLHTGLARAIHQFGRAVPVGATIPTGRAYRHGLVACVAVRVEEPQFDLATRSRLGNREVASLVATAAQEALGQFLRDRPGEARAIFRHVLAPRRADPKTGMPS